MDFSPEQLNTLHKMLNAINVDDEYISHGVTLTTNGMEKVARKFGIEKDDVYDMLLALSKQVQMNEDSPRFTYETDILGNVTIRDANTGNEKFIQGDDAFKLINDLEKNPAHQQAIIAAYFNIEVLYEGDDMDDKIVQNKGTFNFPYKGKFATALYGLNSSGEFVLSVESLRDSLGNEIPITDEEELKNIAMKWIDKV